MKKKQEEVIKISSLFVRNNANDEEDEQRSNCVCANYIWNIVNEVTL